MLTDTCPQSTVLKKQPTSLRYCCVGGNKMQSKYRRPPKFTGFCVLMLGSVNLGSNGFFDMVSLLCCVWADFDEIWQADAEQHANYEHNDQTESRIPIWWTLVYNDMIVSVSAAAQYCFGLGDVSVFKRSKTICKANFDDISPSKSEI